MAFEAKLTVTLSTLPTADEANKLNERMSSLLYFFHGEGPGDLVVGAEVIEYEDEDGEE